MIKAVLFDLDGVLTDTAVYHYKSWKLIAESFVDDMISGVPVVGSTLVDAVDGVEEQERDFEDQA